VRVHQLGIRIAGADPKVGSGNTNHALVGPTRRPLLSTHGIGTIPPTKRPQGVFGLEVRFSPAISAATREPYGRRPASAGNNNGNRFGTVLTCNPFHVDG
jgi:hypothetical protein